MSTLSVTNLTTGSATTSLGITTGNTSATGMFLSSNGNVGIGTTTPNYSGYGTSNLTVRGGTTIQGVLELVGTRGDVAGNAVGDINFFAESNTLGNKRVAFIQSTLSGNQTGDKGGALAFYTKADGSSTTLARMFIDNAGYIGIGTVSPALKTTIEANGGQLRIRNTTTRYRSDYLVDSAGTSSLVTYDDTGAVFKQMNIYASPLTFNTTSAGAETMRIDASGNVGIGTNTPSTYNNSRLAVYTTGNKSATFVSNVPGSPATIDDQEFVSFQHISAVNGLTFSSIDPRILSGTVSTSNGIFWRARVMGLMSGEYIPFRVGNGNEAARFDANGKLILSAAGQGIQFADGTTQTSAASTTTGAIGSYAFLTFIGTGTITAGSSYAGSSFQYGQVYNAPCGGYGAVGISGVVASGTWKAMGGGVGGYYPTTLFVRIA